MERIDQPFEQFGLLDGEQAFVLDPFSAGEPGAQAFDNENLFDQAGHLTDAGLHALRDGTLDELGRLEAAEHLTFCDLCLMRYTAMLEAMPEKLQKPMRDLIPQVQALMRMRSIRVMTNRYVSVAAAVVLAFGLWQFSAFGRGLAKGWAPADPATLAPRTSFSQTMLQAFGGVCDGLNGIFDSFQSSAQSGLAQLADPFQSFRNGGNETADGE